MTALEHIGSPSASVYGDAHLLGERFDRGGAAVGGTPRIARQNMYLVAGSVSRQLANSGAKIPAENSENPETPAVPERRDLFRKSRTGAESFDGAGVSEDFDDLDGAAAEILSDLIPDFTLRSATAARRGPFNLAEGN